MMARKASGEATKPKQGRKKVRRTGPANKQNAIFDLTLLVVWWMSDANKQNAISELTLLVVWWMSDVNERTH